MNRKLLNTLMLLLAALIWGSTFVAQSVGMDQVEPFTFSAVRITMGGIALLPVIRMMDILRGRGKQPLLPLRQDHTLLRGGLACGGVMCLAINLQQVGIQFTTAGKCGFITTLYVAFVPILSVIWLRRRYGFITWLGVAVAVAGMYFLSMTEDFTITREDTLVYLSAVVFACHILVIDHFAPQVDGVRLACMQQLVSGGISIVLMLLFEHPQLASILAAWLPICYAGLLSSAVAYTLQVLCQKEVEPTLASIVMSLESVFSVLSGWLVLHERLSPRELLGCALTFCAVLLVELAPNFSKEEQNA